MWLLDQYKKDNGFLPIIVEMGETASMRDDSNWIVCETMYKVFKQMGVEAVLIDQTEIRDLETYFLKRLNLPVPNVLSNVYPKDPQSSYAKLLQSWSRTLPNGSRIFFINILNPTYFQNQQNVITQNYEIIPPEQFLRDFVPQISPGDVLVARLSLDKVQLANLFKMPEAGRIDMAILPVNESSQYLNEAEQVLTKKNFGWVPENKPENPEAPPLPTQPGEIVGPPQAPETAFGSPHGETKEGTEGGADKSANQGGEKTGEGNDQEHGKGIISVEEAKKSATDLPSNAAPVEPPPPPQNPLPPPDVDYKVDDRQYLDIINEHRVVPEVQSSEFMREIDFKRNGRGQRVIKVSDLVLYENLPEDPAIKKLAEETDILQKETREKTTTIRIAKTYAEGSRNFQQNENPYVGPEKCKECHELSYKVWESSVHAKAMASLKKKKEDKNEACLKCHNTAWEPQTGWGTWEFGNHGNELGCEACHGPGGGHIALINYIILPERRKYWDIVKKELPYLGTKGPLSMNNCLVCHDKANSPNFDFVKYWDMIVHDEPELKELPQPKPPEPTAGPSGIVSNAPPHGVIPGGTNQPGANKPGGEKKPDTKKPKSGKDDPKKDESKK